MANQFAYVTQNTSQQVAVRTCGDGHTWLEVPSKSDQASLKVQIVDCGAVSMTALPIIAIQVHATTSFAHEQVFQLAPNNPGTRLMIQAPSTTSGFATVTNKSSVSDYDLWIDDLNKDDSSTWVVVRVTSTVPNIVLKPDNAAAVPVFMDADGKTDVPTAFVLSSNNSLAIQTASGSESVTVNVPSPQATSLATTTVSTTSLVVVATPLYPNATNGVVGPPVLDISVTSTAAPDPVRTFTVINGLESGVTVSAEDLDSTILRAQQSLTFTATSSPAKVKVNNTPILQTETDGSGAGAATDLSFVYTVRPLQSGPSGARNTFEVQVDRGWKVPVTNQTKNPLEVETKWLPVGVARCEAVTQPADRFVLGAGETKTVVMPPQTCVKLGSSASPIILFDPLSDREYLPRDVPGVETVTVTRENGVVIRGPSPPPPSTNGPGAGGDKSPGHTPTPGPAQDPKKTKQYIVIAVIVIVVVALVLGLALGLTKHKRLK
jgi:hypothetical protein